MSSFSIIDEKTGLMNIERFKEKYPYGHAIVKVSDIDNNLGEIVVRGAGSPFAHKKIYEEQYANKGNYIFVTGEKVEL